MYLFDLPLGGSEKASGITYDPTNNSLWVVVGASAASSTRILELALDGTLKGQFSGSGMANGAAYAIFAGALATDYGTDTLWWLPLGDLATGPLKFAVQFQHRRPVPLGRAARPHEAGLRRGIRSGRAQQRARTGIARTARARGWCRNPDEAQNGSLAAIRSEPGSQAAGFGYRNWICAISCSVSWSRPNCAAAMSSFSCAMDVAPMIEAPRNQRLAT